MNGQEKIEAYLSSVRHDLRSQLMVVREGVSMILDGIGDSNCKTCFSLLRPALESTDELNKLIGELINTSRLNAMLAPSTSVKDEEWKNVKKELLAKEEELKGVKKELIGKHEELKSVKRELIGKDEELRSLKKEILGKDEEFRSVKKELQGKDEELKSVKKELLGKDEERGRIRKELLGKNEEMNGVKKELLSKDEELKAVKTELLQKDEELKRVEKDLLTKGEKLKGTEKESMEGELEILKYELMGMISHSIRTPLAVVKESLSLVLDEIPGKLGPKQKELLSNGKKNADELIQSIEEIFQKSWNEIVHSARKQFPTEAIARKDRLTPKKRILIVEDQAIIVDMLKMRLEANHYEVITAGDGQEGLEKAQKENPSLIILDIMLPKMNGYKVCQLLKSDQKYNKIPIIISSGRTPQEIRKVGQEVGADAYVSKPFEAEVLLSKIKELLEKRGNPC